MHITSHVTDLSNNSIENVPKAWVSWASSHLKTTRVTARAMVWRDSYYCGIKYGMECKPQWAREIINALKNDDTAEANYEQSNLSINITSDRVMVGSFTVTAPDLVIVKVTT